MENKIKKRRVVIVDDNDLVTDGLYRLFKGTDEFEVKTASTREEAIQLLETMRFDLAVLDINLEGNNEGKELSVLFRNLYPHMGIIIHTAYPKSLVGSNHGADICVEKGNNVFDLIEIARSIIDEKRLPFWVRKRRYRALKSLSGFNEVQLVSTSLKEDNSIAFNGVCKRDGKSLKWVLYNIPGVNENRFNLGIASTIGCNGKCVFCKSGLNRPLERQLSKSEIISQVYLALNSRFGTEAFRYNQKMTVNFTCEGDSIFYNAENCCHAIEDLRRMEGCDMNFIMTSIGHSSNLKMIREKYDLSKISFYWSLNSLDTEFRNKIMPTTKECSVMKIANEYMRIQEKYLIPVTVSWIVFKGLNDTDKDIEELIRFFGKYPFIMKVMPLVKHGKNGSYLTNQKAAADFVLKLQSASVPARLRTIVGSEAGSGCGTTVPPEWD